jgi:hypothetical protein
MLHIVFEKEKIETEDFFFPKVCLTPILQKSSYVLALLNSRLLDRYMKETIRDNFRGGYLSLNKQFLGLLPITVPQDKGEKEAAMRIADRSLRIIETKKRLVISYLSDRETAQLEREIEAHEKRIDELVCELYGMKEIPE